jgi:hypothetical protein
MRLALPFSTQQHPEQEVYLPAMEQPNDLITITTTTRKDFDKLTRGLRRLALALPEAWRDAQNSDACKLMCMSALGLSNCADRVLGISIGRDNLDRELIVSIRDAIAQELAEREEALRQAEAREEATATPAAIAGQSGGTGPPEHDRQRRRPGEGSGPNALRQRRMDLLEIMKNLGGRTGRD